MHQRDHKVRSRLLLDLAAFFLEHRLCGDLDGDVTDDRASLACQSYGARIERPVETPQRS